MGLLHNYLGIWIIYLNEHLGTQIIQLFSYVIISQLCPMALYLIDSLYVLGILALQQAAVRGNLLLQARLDVHENLVLMILALHVASELGQLLLHASDQDLELCQLGAIAAFCFCQGAFQSSFLGMESRGKRIQ